MDMEKWVAIVDYPSYEVSDSGSVRTVARTIRHPRGFDANLKSRVITKRLSAKGYILVNIENEDGQKSRQVHRLVAQAFIDNPNNKPQVNHKNGIKTDNRVENLEWCTNRENIIHAYANGLIDVAKGEGSGRSKLKTKDVVSIRERRLAGITTKDLSETYGVCKSTIKRIINRKLWSHV